MNTMLCMFKVRSTLFVAFDERSSRSDVRGHGHKLHQKSALHVHLSDLLFSVTMLESVA